MAAFLQQDVLVRYSAGTYITNTVNGERASCSAGAQQAADALGKKLFGERFHAAERQLRGGTNAEVWRLFYRRPTRGAR